MVFTTWSSIIYCFLTVGFLVSWNLALVCNTIIMLMRFVLIFFLLQSPTVFSQGFTVYQDFYDSIPSGFSFHLTGEANLTDSMVVDVEVRSADSLHTLLYHGNHNMSTGVSTFADFIYDPVQYKFTIQLGNFPSKQMEIWLRALIDGVIREELLLVEFD